MKRSVAVAAVAAVVLMLLTSTLVARAMWPDATDKAPQAFVIGCSPTVPQGSTLYPNSLNLFPHAFDGSLAQAEAYVKSRPGCWQVIAPAKQGKNAKKTAVGAGISTE